MTEEARRPQAEDAIRRFLSTYAGERSASIWTDPNIPRDVLHLHRSQYFNPSTDERPLVVLNKKAWFFILGFGWSGLTITDKAVHFCAIDNSIFASIVPIKKKGAIEFAKIKSIEIAEHDNCLGTAYIGHKLKINGTIAGYVRMGGNILLDEGAITFLNGLFTFLSREKVIEKAPNEYVWQ